MDVDSIRAHCLSFPNVSETLQWGDHLCFKVGGKIFALMSLDITSGTRLSVKCSPERFAELLEIDGCHPAPYVGRYKWIGLERLDSLSDRDLEAVIGESYALVAAKAPRKTVSANPKRGSKPRRRA
jgi:predicted DNA-binding protein (MmcQ/YjbR family)